MRAWRLQPQYRHQPRRRLSRDDAWIQPFSRSPAVFFKFRGRSFLPTFANHSWENAAAYAGLAYNDAGCRDSQAAWFYEAGEVGRTPAALCFCLKPFFLTLSAHWWQARARKGNRASTLETNGPASSRRCESHRTGDRSAKMMSHSEPSKIIRSAGCPFHVMSGSNLR